MILSLVSVLRLACYGMATYFLARHLQGPDSKARDKGTAALAAGLSLGAGILAWRAGLAGALPLFTRFDLLGLFAFTVSVAFLILLWQRPVHALGAVILPVPLAALALGLVPGPFPQNIPPSLQNPWVGGHVVLFFLAYSALLLGFGLGFLYLILERQLKKKKISVFFFRLPPLEELDQSLGRSETLGFICLTAAIAVAERGFRASGIAWTLDPKMAAIFATWAVYAIYLFLRLARGWRGRRSALFSVCAFILVLIAFLGIEIFLPGHGRKT